jgi:hypothetical protein
MHTSQKTCMCIEGVISGKSDENKKVWGYATRMPAKMEHACARMSQKMYAQGLFLGKVMLYHANAIPCHPMQSHDSLCQPISIFVSSLKIKGEQGPVQNCSQCQKSRA